MTDAIFQVQKLTAVPTTPTTPHTLFLVALPDKPTHMEVYMSDKTGTLARRTLSESDVQAMIATALSSANQVTIVADINARNSLTNKNGTVYVKNATADSTVKKGGAYYLYDTQASSWIKISEAESMDVALTWASLAGKPTSTPQAIDLAVTNSHTHANATQLDKIGEIDGKLAYDGKLVGTTINDAW